MSTLELALGTLGATIAQRAMSDMPALDALVDPHRAHPDSDFGDMGDVMERRLTQLVAKLRTPSLSTNRGQVVHISRRGYDIGNVGSEQRADGTLVFGAGTLALEKILRDEAANPAFGGKAGSVLRDRVNALPKPTVTTNPRFTN